MTILQDLEAARDALKGIVDEFVKVFPIYYYAEPWAHDKNIALIQARAALSRLSALIEQVRGQEPVLTVEVEPDHMSRGHFYKGTKPHIDPTKVWGLPIGTKLYTHPQGAKHD